MKGEAMSKRIERSGIELEMWVHAKCADLLMKLEPPARKAVVDWLAARIVGTDKSQAPLARQTEAFPD